MQGRSGPGQQLWDTAALVGHEVVGSLCAESEEFAALWVSPTVYGKTRDATELEHPDVGPLALVAQSFDVRGAAGQLLVVYLPEPGSRSAEALTLLGSLHAHSGRRA